MNVFKYRPDIDGLRAIAVLSVVLFHINPNGYQVAFWELIYFSYYPDF